MPNLSLTYSYLPPQTFLDLVYLEAGHTLAAMALGNGDLEMDVVDNPSCDGPLDELDVSYEQERMENIK